MRLHCGADPKACATTVAFMIDQSHNLKGKIEATVQTVVTAQELWLKAALVDREQLAAYQQSCDLVAAEELFRGAFWRDVRPLAAPGARRAACPPTRWPRCAKAAMSNASPASVAAASQPSTATPENVLS